MLPRFTYSLPGSSTTGSRNKLSNLQLLASLAKELPFTVPRAHVLDGQHFYAAIENVLPGALPTLIPETLNAPLASRLRQHLLVQPLPEETALALRAIHNAFQDASGSASLCVRSCFELEDRERQSFAGAFETVHAVDSFAALCSAVQVVYASVFAERALAELQGITIKSFPPMSVAVQTMVGGIGWVGGVAHTQAPDLAPYPLMLISAAEDSAAVTSGASIPEDYLVHRDYVTSADRAIVIQRQAGTLTTEQFSLSTDRLRELAKVLLALEARFESPLEVEWLLDPHGQLYLLQARAAPRNSSFACSPWPSTTLEPLASGLPVGHGAISAKLFHARTVSEAQSAPPGSILVTDNTDPEWVPAIRRAAGIVTRIGARTSHVARTARESGVLAVVGCGDAIEALRDGASATIFCAEGLLGAVYAGIVKTGHVLTPAESVSIRHVSEAFSIARSYRPDHVHLELEPILAAYRLPKKGTSTAALAPRMRRRIAGHPSVDAFVHDKIVEAICLVAVAFPEANISTALPTDSPWKGILLAAAGTCLREFGTTIEVLA